MINIIHEILTMSTKVSINIIDQYITIKSPDMYSNSNIIDTILLTARQ